MLHSPTAQRQLEDVGDKNIVISTFLSESFDNPQHQPSQSPGIILFFSSDWSRIECLLVEEFFWALFEVKKTK